MKHEFAPIMGRIKKVLNAMDINAIMRALGRVTDLDEAPLVVRHQVGESLRDKVAEVATLAVAQRDYENRFGNVFDAPAYDKLVERLGLVPRKADPSKIPHLPQNHTRVGKNEWQATAHAT